MDQENLSKMDILQEARQKRSRIRAVVTRFVNLARTSMDTAVEGRVESLRKNIQDKATELEIVNDTIQRLIDEDDLAEDIDDCLDYSSKIEATLKLFDTYYRTYEKRTAHSNCNVKLPKLQLPTFAGNELEFRGFWDVFNTAILQSTNLTDVQKFIYLKSCLSGEAKTCIAGLSLSAENFALAVDILTEKFGRTDAIIRQHIQKLQSCKAPTSMPTSLKQFLYEINLHSRSLENLHITSDQYEIMLVPLLLQKLPDEVRLRILTKDHADVYTLKGFISLLAKEIEMREECKVYSQHSKSFPTGKPVTQYTVSQHETNFQQDVSAMSLATHSVSKNQLKRDKKVISRKYCAYCEATAHYSSDCPVIKDVESRVSYLKENQRCFICLRKFHNARNCRPKKRCQICSRLHHMSICTQIDRGKISDTSIEVRDVSSNRVDDHATSKQQVTLYLKGSRNVILPSAKVVLRSEDGEETLIRALLDQCSTKTFIRSDICKDLSMKPEFGELVKVNAFGAESQTMLTAGKVQCKIRKVDGYEEIPLVAQVVDTICVPQPSYRLSGFSQFSDLELADEYDYRDADEPISLLIGADFYYDVVTDKTIRGEGGPVALSSKVGWLASGVLSVTGDPIEEVDVLHVDCAKTGDELLEQFWELEHIGITDKGDATGAEFLPDASFDADLNAYSIQLPWKIEKNDLALKTNFDVSLRRLKSVLKQLRSNPALLSEYQRILYEQLASDVLESVPDAPDGSIIHYLPHHPVIRPNATSTKVRIVLDASSHARGEPSLNDCVVKGPCRLPQIPALLIKFRLNPIAILADLEKAFLQIAVDKIDRDALRIIWVDDPHDVRAPLKIFRYKALIFGLKCSPAVLEHIIHLHLRKFEESEPVLIEKLENEVYVDNLISGESSLDKAIELFRKSREIFSKGHFNLRQWHTNDPEFQEFIESQIGQTEPAVSIPTFGEVELNPTTTSSKHMKVLGLLWDNASDEFILDLSFLKDLKSEHYRKRDLLHVTVQIYDPLGILCPILIQPKMLFQQVCKSKSKWDSLVDENVEQEFNIWIEDALHLVFRVRRYIQLLSSDIIDVSLHGFSDASSVCYAAVIYLRIGYVSGRNECFFIMAKSRIAPFVKPQTIPRLELLGTLILSRLLSFVIQLFPSVRYHCWCDSRTVLFWIQQEHKIWKTYVQNRVCEIRRLVGADCWNFVPGDANPCDVATRPITPRSLKNNMQWFRGPDWLHSSPEDWPKDVTGADTDVVNVIDAEVESVPHVVLHVQEIHGILKIIDMKRYDSYETLLRVCAYVLRISPSHRRLHEPLHSIELSSSEIDHAELQLIRALQEVDYASELSHLKHGTASTGLTRNLRLVLDENGLIRTRGRLSSCLTVEANCPVLLPRNENFCRLFINYAHGKTLHGGVSATLSKIRERYWLLKGRQAVKRELRKCFWCKRISGLPYKNTPIPDLPHCRVEQYRAFQTVGLDYCGPLRYRSGEDRSLKCYVCLFTCTATRAVHLELVSDLSTRTFLRAFRRFCSRRGIPSVISDNFSSFKRAFNELTAASEDPLVRRHVAVQRIDWKFITEYSPWQGGFYERLVGDLKTALKKVLKFSTLEFDELQTVLSEIEAVMNSRPLCYVADEVEQVITPSHFLILKRHISEPNARNSGSPPVEVNLVTRLKGCRRFLDRFWRVWYERYITSLRERSMKNSRASNVVPAAGDIVLLKEDKPRLQWKIGRIETCTRGRDGATRSALVRIAGGRGSTKLVRRPTKLLIPLESSTNSES